MEAVVPGTAIARPPRRWGEEGIRLLLFLCAAISVVTTAGIILVLVRDSIPFFREVPLGDFLFGTQWTPLFEPKAFGVLPLLAGTFLVVAGASVIALPTGLGSAVYLSEFATDRMRGILKPILEILAGIPTVVYGYFALIFVTPVLQGVLPQTKVFNAASASIVVGIMILPTVASLCDEALRAVPRDLRRGAYALGATPFEVTVQVTVPSALSGILAAFILAISRAIGETMAVTIAAGGMPNLTLNPLESVQTMTAFIVQVSLGDTPTGTVEYHTLFAVGALLFAITLGMNLTSHWIVRRFRRAYE